MSGIVRRGLVAGAAGTLALNMATYLDMALKGRPASRTPERTIEALAGRAGITVAGSGAEREARVSAVGALSGMATGLAVGVGASTARAAGVRLPAPLGGALIGAAAMTAGNGPMALLGVTDPRSWSRADWLGDVLPHVAYGVAARAALDTVDREHTPGETLRPATGALVRRSLALGLAAGGRSSLGLGAPLLWSRRSPRRLRDRVAAAGALAGIGTEVLVDLQPGAPSRLEAPGVHVRVGSAAAGVGILSAREQAAPALPLLAASAGSIAGAVGGAAWRAWASARVPAWQAALVEDGVAIALARWACR